MRIVLWNRLRRALRAPMALLLLLALTGCTGVQIGYRHADIFLSWKVNEYFDLDETQGAMVKPAIESVLSWHRRSELPDYARLLEAAQARLKTGVAAEDVRLFDGEVRALTRKSIERLALEGAPILATVTPAQISELEQRLAKDNEAYYDKYARGPMEKQQLRRFKRFVENAEHWVGNLTDEQKDRIQAIVAEAPTRYAQQLEERMRVQREFVALLREKNTTASIIPKLRAWIARWDAGRSPAFVEIVRISNDQLSRMALTVTDSMTPDQKQHAQQQLQSYIDAVRGLAQPAAPESTPKKACC